MMKLRESVLLSFEKESSRKGVLLPSQRNVVALQGVDLIPKMQPLTSHMGNGNEKEDATNYLCFQTRTGLGGRTGNRPGSRSELVKKLGY